MQISKDKKTAILVGASGMVGGKCLDLLLLSSAYDRIILFGRKKLPIESEKLVQHIIKFDRLPEYKDLFKGDDLFCCLGTTMRKAGSKDAFRKVDFTYIYEIAKMASANKVNQFLLVSSVGADPESLIFYNRVKGKTEEAVRSLTFWATHIFQPSLLLGERNENRWGEEIATRIGKRLDSLLGGLLSKYRPVEAEVVAKAMLHAAQGLKGGLQIYSSEQLSALGSGEQRLEKGE